jgi:succinoglycan biosynthesis protein ExoM
MAGRKAVEREACARVNLEPVRSVSIVVPTLRREERLPDLIERLFAQQKCRHLSFEIVIADNCPNESARPIVVKLQRKYGGRLRYVTEPQPGVSFVRNAALEAANGRLIAFIDDDEIPSGTWLAELVHCRQQYGADVVLGPVYPVFEVPQAGEDPFFRESFTQTSERATGAVVEPMSLLRMLFRPGACYRIMATNNALVDVNVLDRSGPTFEPALTHLGGEDIVFFHNLYLAGRKIVWSRDAAVYEYIPAERSELRYLLERRFRNGQITSATCLMTCPRQYGRLMVSVGLGMAQLIIGMVQLASYCVAGSQKKARDALSLAAGGAGKIVWMRRFQRRSYGLTAEGRAG